MDNNTNSQSNNSNSQKPGQSYLANENLEVLSNSDIKATVSSGSYSVNTNQVTEPQVDNSTGYASPYSSPYANQQQAVNQNPQQPVYGQEVYPQQQNLSQQDPNQQNPISLSQIQSTGQALTPQTPPVQNYAPQQPTQNYQPTPPQYQSAPQQNVFGTQFTQANSQLPTENPLQTKTNVIYKTEQKGGGFLGRIFGQLFNCVGCLLFIIAIFIAVFVYFINI